MAKKTFVLKARLVKGTRWHVEYWRYNPLSDQYTRHRNEFDLNKIDNELIRQEVGQRLVKYLSLFDDALRPERPADAPAPLQDLTVGQAVTEMLAVKTGPTAAKTTRKDYRGSCREFEAWARRLRYWDMRATDFSKRHARAFWDFLGARKKKDGTPLAGRTLNNKLNLIRALFFEMADRDIIRENPFKSIREVRTEEKRRRIFTPEEQRTVAMEAERADYWLFRGILLQYYCYIRPIELTRMRFRDLDLGAGVVAVEVRKGKRARRRFATIPAAVMHYFRDGRFDKYPGNYYVFGITDLGGGEYTMAPSLRACDYDRMYKRHKRILTRLVQRGDLRNTNGLSWYSWKDTGISRHAGQTAPLSTRDQAGHTSFDMTLTYYHANKINEEYRNLKNDLF